MIIYRGVVATRNGLRSLAWFSRIKGAVCAEASFALSRPDTAEQDSDSGVPPQTFVLVLCPGEPVSGDSTGPWHPG